jgi:cobalt/nickel transport system permease protein
MTSVHMAIGVGEGLISALVLLAIQRVRPDLTSEVNGGEPSQPWGELVRYGLLAALGVAVFVAPFACSWPDGLESVAAKLGFEHKAVQSALPAPAPGYHVPGVRWAVGATALAGAVGAVIVFGLALLLARSLVPEGEGDAHLTKP